MSLKDIRVLVPKTCGHLALHGKRKFVGVIKLRIWRWGDLSWILWVGLM